MSTDLLREAAAKMRELALLVTADGDVPEWYSRTEMWEILRRSEPEHSRTGHDAAYIASWDPAVALTVADLFETCAAVEHLDLLVQPAMKGSQADLLRAVVAAARAYLGRPS